MSRHLSSLSIPPSILSALTRAGYDTVQDLSTSSAEALSKDLSIPLSDSQALFSLPSLTQARTQSSKLPLTQSASSTSIAKSTSDKFSTGCSAIDKLLGGRGLPRGCILEVSGPPGCGKESVAVGVVRSFLERGEGVLFVDCQNMTGPKTLQEALQRSRGPALPEDYKSLTHHLDIITLPSLLIFIYNLPAYLSSHHWIKLIVLNTLSSPFLSLPTPSQKTHVFSTLKATLARVTVQHNLTVVTTSQLATKIINEDGSWGTFDTGSKAVMVPALGDRYLPSGRAYRLIVHPLSRTGGIVKVLSLPRGRVGAKEEYVVEGGVMR